MQDDNLFGQIDRMRRRAWPSNHFPSNGNMYVLLPRRQFDRY